MKYGIFKDLILITLLYFLLQSERGSALLPLTQALINLKEQQELAEVSAYILALDLYARKPRVDNNGSTMLTHTHIRPRRRRSVMNFDPAVHHTRSYVCFLTSTERRKRSRVAHAGRMLATMATFSRGVTHFAAVLWHKWPDYVWVLGFYSVCRNGHLSRSFHDLAQRMT